MKPILNMLAFVAALSGGPAFSNEWTTAYAGLGRTSYLAGETIAPPFAVAWEWTGSGDLLAAPLVAMDRAFVTTRGLLVTSLELATGREVWGFKGPRSADEIVSFDSMTGQVRWRDRVDAAIVHTPQIGHPVVYVGSAAGTLTAFNQNGGTKMWSVSLGAPLTLAAVDATLLVIGAGTALVGLNPADGATLFRVELGAAPAFFPVLDGTGIIVPLPGHVVAFDRAAKEIWRAASGKPVSAPVAVTKSGILVGLADGTVRLLARADGAVVWENILAGSPSSLSGTADTVYAGTKQGTLVGLRLADGAKSWSAALGHGAVLGASMAGGRLLVTAGPWLGALVPAPDSPANLSLRRQGNDAVLSWDAPQANGSAISGYRVWRRRGSTLSPAGVVAAPPFTERLLAGDSSYAVTAVAVNGAESVRSAEASLKRGEQVLKRLSVSPVPYDPKGGALAVTFELSESAQVSWSIVDAEGQVVMEERSVLLPKGDAALSWDGLDRLGAPVARGTMQVRVRAAAQGETESAVRAFPVDWKDPAQASSGSGSGPVHAASVAPASKPGASGSAPAVDGGATTGRHDNGVRDLGQGEGRDGAGQGRGQGSDNGKK